MIEYRGTMHQIGMDRKTIMEIGHSIVVSGKIELALQFLTNASFTPAEAQEFIGKITMEMAFTQQSQPQDVPEDNPVPEPT